MGRGSHQITQKDVTFWGAAALVCGAMAVLAGSLGGVLPSTLTAQFHGTRMTDGSVHDMRALLDQIRQDAAELALAERHFAQRMDLMDRASAEMMRRVGAVERSIPLLAAALPFDSDIDRSLLTASITPRADDVIAVEGGMMALNQEVALASDIAGQPMPSAVSDPFPPPDPMRGTSDNALGDDPLATASIASDRPENDAGHAEIISFPLGLDLGISDSLEETAARWERLMTSVGPLLLGLEARIVAHDEGVTLLAGPFMTRGAAEAVCARLILVGSDCSVAAFEGDLL